MNYYKSGKKLKTSKKGKRKNSNSYQIVVERQNFDWNNPSGEKASKETGTGKPKTVRKIIRESIQIIFVSLIILTLTVLTYFGLYNELSKLTISAPSVTVSSEGPAAEMYPESMGMYMILKDIYRNNRAVYKHVDREDRFIIFARSKEYGENGGFWYIANKLQADRGFIRSISEGDVIVPQKGWRYITKCKATR